MVYLLVSVVCLNFGRVSVLCDAPFPYFLLSLSVSPVFCSSSDNFNIKIVLCAAVFDRVLFYFSGMRRDTQTIWRMTPREKQVIMCGTTLTKEMRTLCQKFMQDVNITVLCQSSHLSINAH
jgi:hypothetical protein